MAALIAPTAPQGMPGLAAAMQPAPRTLDVLSSAKSFAGLLLPPAIGQALKEAGFRRPSPVQEAALPLARMGTDLIVQAKAGTGKTLVFAVAAVERVDLSNGAPQVPALALDAPPPPPAAARRRPDAMSTWPAGAGPRPHPGDRPPGQRGGGPGGRRPAAAGPDLRHLHWRHPGGGGREAAAQVGLVGQPAAVDGALAHGGRSMLSPFSHRAGRG